jgi:hypothetical protein
MTNAIEDYIKLDRGSIAFTDASRTLGPAMAKALLEAEEALKMSSGTGTHSATRIVVDQALAAIQRVKEGV